MLKLCNDIQCIFGASRLFKTGQVIITLVTPSDHCFRKILYRKEVNLIINVVNFLNA